MNEQIRQEVLNLIQNASSKAPEVLSQACSAQVFRLTGGAITSGAFFIISGVISVWVVKSILKLIKEEDMDAERGFGFIMAALLGTMFTGCFLVMTIHNVLALVSWKLNPYGELLLKLIGDAS